MSKFSETDKKRLLSNRFVEKITNSQIVFTAEFKIKAVEENLRGKSPQVVFKDANLDTSIFVEMFSKKSIERWKKIYLEEGPKGLREEKRGKGATGRPLKKFESAEEELAYLRMENEFLKKLHALAAQYPKKKNTH